MKHKIYLFAVLLMAVATPKIAAAYDFSYTYQGKTLYFNIVNGEAQVTNDGSYNVSYSTGNDYIVGDVVIPSTVTYNNVEYTVTSISNSAFYGCSYITSMVLPNTLKTIGSQSFYGCQIANIVVPDGVTSIGDWAFVSIRHIEYHGPASYNSYYRYWNAGSMNGYTEGDFVYSSDSKTSLWAYLGNDASVTIPSTVTSIGRYAFEYCSNLTSVTLHDGITSIGDRVFLCCENLLTVNIPGSVHSIGTGAFSNSGITSVTINDGVESIGENAFEYCHRLTSINIPNSVTSIGQYAFYQDTLLATATIGTGLSSLAPTIFYCCYNLSSFEINSPITSIGSSAFSNCRSLMEFEIPSTVTTIGASAFYYCTGIVSMTIPSTVNSIGNNAFERIRHIEYHGEATGAPWGALSMNGVVDGGFVFSDVTKTVLVGYVGSGGDVVIPSTVNTIVPKTFAYCETITSVTIPSTVLYIGDSAFYCCDNILFANIPEHVTEIGKATFYGCHSLDSVYIGESVASIGDYAFYLCTHLSSINAKPTTPPSVGSYSFSNVPSSVKILVPCGSSNSYSNSSRWRNSFYNFQETDGTDGRSAVSPSGHMLYYNIENGEAQVTFQNTNVPAYTNLTGVLVIPDSVTLNCVKYAVTSIGNNAFRDCRGLTSVYIPNTVTSIGSDAFYLCSGLTSVTISNNVSTIGSWAFASCSNLTSLNIPSALSAIGDHAFWNCEKLASIEVDNGNSVYDSRENCNAIIETATDKLILGCKNTTIPNSVTAIGDYAFGGCRGLTSLTIHRYITSIGNEVFNYCSGLTSIEVESGNSVYDSRENCNAIIETATNKLIVGCKNTVFPNSVTSIGNAAFYGCSGLTTLTVPNTVTSIGSYAFTWCSGLDTVIIGNSVTTIEHDAFYICEGLTSLTIGRSVTSLDSWAFGTSRNLEVITCLAPIAPEFFGSNVFPNNIYSIPVYVPCGLVSDYQNASGWSNFTNIQETFPYVVTVGSNDQNQGTAGVTTVPSCTSNSATLTATANCGYRFTQWNDGNTNNPRTVTVTSDTAFTAEFEVEAITEFDAVTTSNHTLHYTVNADGTSVTITGHEDNISGDLTIPATVSFCSNTYTVTTIGHSAFVGCSNLTSVTIPSTITYFGVNALWTYGLGDIDIRYLGTLSQWCNIDFNGYAIDGFNLYVDNTLVTDLVIPDGITHIKRNTFDLCKSLTSITIPSSVTSIGASAFISCTGVTSVTLPESLITIGSQAFENCSSLTEITCLAPTAPTLENTNAFNSVPTSIPVYVPCGSLASYQAVDGWNRFTNLQEVAGCSHTVTVTSADIAMGTVSGSGTYNQNETVTLTATPNCGYRFKQWSDGNTNNPRTVTVTSDTAITAEFVSVRMFFAITTNGQTLYYYVNGCQAIVTYPRYGNINSENDPWRGYDEPTGDLVIPDSVVYEGNTYHVTAIGDYAFVRCRDLTSIVIPNSVTSIGYIAFLGCGGLTSVTMPNSVTTIGNWAFSGCSSLTSVTIPNRITTIGWGVFEDCSGLTSVTIPNSVTIIGQNAFNGCSSLTTVTIPDAVTIIDYFAFKGCSGMTTVTIGSSVSTIRQDAFDDCFGLSRTNFTGTLAQWCDIDFDNLHSNPTNYSCNLYVNGIEVRDNLVIPDVVTSIKNYAFVACRGITSISIPNTVTSIGIYAFAGCGGLTSVTIPNSVTSIGHSVFSSCSGLSSIEIESGNPVYDSRNNCNAIIETSTNTLIQGCKNTTIPNSVTSIGDYAFEWCTSLTSITIPDSVTSIGQHAFDLCRALTEINILATNPPTVGAYAFDGVSINTPVYVPCGTVAAYQAANGWGRFTNIQETDGTDGRSAVTSNGQTLYYKIVNGEAQVTYQNSSSPSYNDLTGDLVIPDSVTLNCVRYKVTSIGDSAFYGCSGLTSVTIGDSVTTIGKRAFNNCSGMTSVTIPGAVTTIWQYAFLGCSSLTQTNYTGTIAQWCGIDFKDQYSTPVYYSRRFYLNGTELTTLVIPSEVTEIKKYAFYYCTSLTGALTIPNTVTTIGDNAFSSCSGLTSITLPDNLTAINDGTFSSCSGLTSIVIPESVTTIADNAFRSCNHLTSVIIPDQVTYIGHYAFGSCSSLNTVTIGASVNRIGSGAFYPCNALRSVYVYPTTPPTFLSQPPVTYNPFFSTSSTRRTFYIPCGTTSAYSASEWPSYDNYTEVWNPYNITIAGDNTQMESSNVEIVCNTTVNLTVTPRCGYRFVRWRNANGETVSTDNPFSLTTTQDSVITAEFEALPAVNYAESPSGHMLYYNIENGEAQVIRNDAYLSYTDALIIPDTVTLNCVKYVVTSIGSNAFYGCSGLTSVTIPNSVISIGLWAFRNCSGLTSVTIGSSVISIGNLAFSGCGGLTTITIPNSVTSIGENAFYGCGGLTSVTIGNSVTSIGNQVFYNCSNLTSIIIPNSVTSIGNYVFCGCSSLASVTIGNSLTSIGERVFSGCVALTSIEISSDNTILDSRENGNAIIESTSNTLLFGCNNTTIPNSVVSIADWAFDGCSGLTSVTIPNSVTTIGIRAFSACSGLTSVIIGNNVTDIGAYAFANCSSLALVTIGSSVTSIGNFAFEWCTHITEITCLATTAPTLGSDVFLNVIRNTPIYVPCGTVAAYQAADGWSSFTNIHEVDGCSHTVNVTSAYVAMGSVTGGGEYISGETVTLTAIPNCGYQFTQWSDGNTDNPRTVTVTADITLTAEFEALPVVNYAESPSRHILYYRIVNGEAQVTWQTRSNPRYTDLNGDLVIPDSVILNCVKYKVASIRDSAFYHCTGLTSVVIPNTVSSIGANAFEGCRNMTSVTIPNSVTRINTRTFCECGLTSVTIPNSVTNIGRSAFHACGQLASATIPNSVTNIDMEVFRQTGLTSVTIPNSVRTIGAAAFAESRRLASATISNSVRTLEYWIFMGCSSLASITIPNSVTSIDIHTFSGCGSLTSIEVESGNRVYDSRENCNAIIVTGSNELFLGCMNTIIPNSVTSIANEAFDGCSRLTSITIPSSVNSIGNSAFANCTGLTEITALAAVPPTLGTEPFRNDRTSIPVYVPCDAVATYQTTEGWNIFTNIQGIDCPTTATVTVASNDATKGTVAGGGTYTVGETVTLTATANSGYRFVRWNDNNTDNPRNIIVTHDTSLMAIFDVLTVSVYNIRTCTGQTLLFEVENGNHTAKVIGYVGLCAGSLTVPAWFSVDGERYEVTTIGTHAFEGCTGLESVILPRSITEIETGAFKDCTGIISVDMK